MAKLGQYGHQLHTMTAQEVLDVGVGHLLTQMVCSINNGTCQYDGGSVCCGAAPFIKKYDKQFDVKGTEWGEVVESGAAYSNHLGLIIELQQIHDEHGEEFWATQLRQLATAEKLVYNGEQYE